MKKLILLIILLSSSFDISKAQSFPWAKSGFGMGADEGTAVCLDANGNAIITGYFTSPTVIFGTYTLTNSSGFSDIYITKYDANGNVLWAKNIGGVNDEYAYSISSDGSNNIFITGSFKSSSLVIGTFTINNSGSINAFISKFDSNGNALWAKNASGLSQDEGQGIITDFSGNVFVAGYFTSPTIVFSTYTLTNVNPPNEDAFLVKYDPNGNVLWAKSVSGTNYDVGNSVSTDASGNIFIAGTFMSPILTANTNTLSNFSPPNEDVFLIKYDPNGNVIWAKSNGGLIDDEVWGLSTDASGNSYIVGNYDSPAILFGTTTLTPSGYYDGFIAKYDMNGNAIWAKKIGGTGTDNVWAVSEYSNGVFITGGSSPIASSSFTIGASTYTAPVGSTDPMFIIKYDINGNVICASILSSGGDDWSAISSTPSGDAFITGDFYSPTFFAVGSNTLICGGPSSENAFIAKFSCQPDAIKIIIADLSLKLYPNPSNGTFILETNEELENAEIILINSLGQKVYEQKISQGQNIIIANNLATGLYNYIILQNKGQISNGKLTIE